MDYSIGSELITFSADAQPRALAGHTVRRWYVRDDQGRIVVRYLLSEQDAVERLLGLRIDAFLTASV